MKLCEHSDFQQGVLAAAEHFRDQGLRPAIIEKDSPPCTPSCVWQVPTDPPAPGPR